MDKLSAVESWAEMYNKKDKEHFECQLKLAKLEQKLDKIKKISKNITTSGCSMRNNDCDFSCNKCVLKTLNNVIQIIDEDIK